MPRDIIIDELAELLCDEEIRHPSARAQMLERYMDDRIVAVIAPRRTVGKLVIDEKEFDLVPA